MQEIKLYHSDKEFSHHIYQTIRLPSQWKTDSVLFYIDTFDFSKICKAEQLHPKYINITVNGTNKGSHNTKNAAIKYRINAELKYLYKNA